MINLYVEENIGDEDDIQMEKTEKRKKQQMLRNTV